MGEAAGQPAAPQEVANSFSTERLSPSPSRCHTACARKASKWSRTIPYRMVDGDRAVRLRSMAARRAVRRRALCADSRHQSILRGCLDRFSEVAILTTMVATVFDRFERRRHLGPSFGQVLDPPRRRSVQLLLQLWHDGCRPSRPSGRCHRRQPGNKQHSHPAENSRDAFLRTLESC